MTAVEISAGLFAEDGALGSAHQHESQDYQQVAHLVQDDAQGCPFHAEPACPVHDVVAGNADGCPDECVDQVAGQEPRDGQGKTPGRQGVDQ